MKLVIQLASCNLYQYQKKPWIDVSMDFVEGLPKSQLKDVVLVVVDRFTRSVHFVPLSHPYSAAKVT